MERSLLELLEHEQLCVNEVNRKQQIVNVYLRENARKEILDQAVGTLERRQFDLHVARMDIQKYLKTIAELKE